MKRANFFHILFAVFILVVLLLRLFLALGKAKPVIFPKNQKIEFQATIVDEPKINDYGQVMAVGDAKIYTGLYPRYHSGDRLLIEGMVGDDGRMFGAKVQKVGQESGFGSFKSRLRAKISANIASILPAREATLVLGAILGVDTIDKEFRNELVKTGTIHVVVVSGQNLSIVAGVFMAIAKFLGRRKSLILALLAIFAYAIFTGFEAPVVRAFLMVLVTTLAVYTGREVIAIWSLFLAAFLIVFVSPQAIAEISFQLTFAATLGIITLGKIISESVDRFILIARGPVDGFSHSTSSVKSKSRVYQIDNVDLRALSGSPSTVATPRASATRKFANSILKAFAVPISAYIFTAPIILYYFGQVSPIAPLANVLVVEAVFPVMILGFLLAVCSLVFMPLAQILAYFVFVPAFYFSQVVKFFASLPVGMLSLGGNSLVFVIFFYILVFSLMWLFRYRR